MEKSSRARFPYIRDFSESSSRAWSCVTSTASQFAYIGNSDTGCSTVSGIIEEQVLPRLEGVRQHGSYWMARCPAHPDQVASLQISASNRTSKLHALVHCHAGCPRDEVLDKIGLTWRDMYPLNAPAIDRDPVATYSYYDHLGTIRYRKTKHLAPNGGKYFRYWVPDHTGDWKTGPGCMNGVERLLFRLPQLLAAPKAAAIFYTEGEKDAMALAALGEVATTAGGANDWRPGMAEDLAGRDVVIIADRDKPGYRHALQVHSTVQSQARSVNIVRARAGKDASDHIRAGYSVTDFDWLVL